MGVFGFFPWADRQRGMFISPVPWPSFVQEREEGGFGLAQGGDRRWSQLSHGLIALLTLLCCLQAAPPPRTRVSGWLLCLRVESHRAPAPSLGPGSHLLYANSG